MKGTLLSIALLALIVLSGCTPNAGGGAAGDSASQPQPISAQFLTGGDLSPTSRLALGILQLEQTDQAVDKDQAQTLLPLWQALQTLNNSDTTAAAELDALTRQIQRAMTSEQMSTIAAMELTSESLAELQASGALGFGGPGMNITREAGSGSGGLSGGPPPGDIVGFAGGPPGGLPPGGDFGGLGGGPGGDLSADQIATRQAAIAEMDPAEMQSRMLTGMVIRLLQSKTGELPPDPRAGVMEAVMAVIAEESGLTTDEVRAQMADGKTAAEILATAGGDMTVARAKLVEALSALPNAGEIDAEQLADQWLGR